MTGPAVHPGPVRTLPPALRTGDRVVVVAPSGPVDPQRLARGAALLEGWGLDVRTAPHVLERDPEAPYLAGTDAQRAGDLQAAWTDPGVRAVLCARGGYGAARLLPLLDWAALAAAGPRLLVGSSDVTALHSAFGARLGLVTLFGPMMAAEILAGADGPEPTTAAALRSGLSDPGGIVLAGVPAPGGGRAVGRLAGGTLALLASAVGTPDPPDLDSAVLVLEEVGEAPYRLDRAWSQLAASGHLDGVVGVALGDLTRCGDSAVATLVRLADRLAVPVLTGLRLGHGPVQECVPLGATAVLDADAGTLTVVGTA